MNLCIDIDGTITDPYYWLERANEYFHKNVRPADVTQYEIHKALGIEAGEFRDFYYHYGALLHKESKIRFGVKELLPLFHQQHQVHFVSAREEKMRDVTMEWLAHYKIPADTVSLLGDSNKVWKARQLKSDLFIEDSYENALMLSQAGFEVLLIDCNYNKGPLPANVRRVRNWFEIADHIESCSNWRDQYKLA